MQLGFYNKRFWFDLDHSFVLCLPRTKRNPRNLERLRIAWRPYGYHLEQRGREYWHKLVLSHTGRHLTAQAVHYTGKVVVEATTKDWAIRKQLYKCTDRTAFESLARVFAQRCLECGLIEMSSTLKESVQPDTKIAKFVETVEKEGPYYAELDLVDYDSQTTELVASCFWGGGSVVTVFVEGNVLGTEGWDSADEEAGHENGVERIHGGEEGNVACGWEQVESESRDGGG
ncbi:hypothetical protein B566_EDAN013703 [Ephemera danica]|nr:hypothetical protein B566_EDAN013703 [Ephemera danica]